MNFKEIGLWIWIVFSVPMAGYILLFYWRLEETTITKTEFVDGVRQTSTLTRPDTWWTLLMWKCMALTFLAMAYLALDEIFGGQWRLIGLRIAATIILVGFAGPLLTLSWILISSHKDPRWTHTREPDADLVAKALEEGPSEALENTVVEALARPVSRLPFSWLAAPLSLAAFSVLILLALRSVWTSDHAVHLGTEPAGGGGHEYAATVFDHVAYYVLGGGLLVAAAVKTVVTFFNRQSGAWGWLAATAGCAAILGIYIVFEGIWP